MTTTELEAMAALSKMRYGQMLIGMLETRLGEVDTLCRSAPLATVQVAQGRAQELVDLIGKIKGADEALKRVRQP